MPSTGQKIKEAVSLESQFFADLSPVQDEVDSYLNSADILTFWQGKEKCGQS